MHPRPEVSSSTAPDGSRAATPAGNAVPESPPSDGPLIALVGSANSGKTTLFNLLTGSHYTTINYPGATVEFAIGAGKGFTRLPCRVMDTPGLTSLIPASLDEKVTVDALFSMHRPDAVVAVVDANQLSRHLYLVRQLQDLGFNPIIALTMSDLLNRRGRTIDAAKLSELLDCPVLPLDPRKKDKAADLGRMIEARLRPEPRAADCCGAEAARDGLPAHKAAVRPDREAAVPAGAEEYRAFAAGMDEERVNGYYRALDEIERMVIADGAGNAGGSGAGADRILLHPVYGLGIFLAAMFAIFTSIFWMATPFMDLIDGAFGWGMEALKNALPASWAVDLLADGAIGGIGAVLVFLPQILILFFAMGYLEDSGYLARGAALVDKPLSKIGLNGKSFVPLLSGYACAIPAMMAARTIPNRFERNLTIFIIPLMSCSARLPVYTLLLAFLTPRDRPWIGGLALTGLYLGGLLLGAAVSTLISKLTRIREKSGFILELPALRKPVLRVVLASTYHKAEQYLRKAGLTIVAISMGLWVLTHTPVPAKAAVESSATQQGVPAADAAADSEDGEYVAVSNSYAARLGHLLEPITRPMGLDWRGGVAMICAFAAREVYVSAMVLMYRIDEEDGDGLTDNLLASMSDVRFEDTGERIFTLSSVLGLILFFMIALQCFPTVAVSRSESGNWKLAAAQLVLYTGGAYALAVALVQGLRALGVA